MTPTAPTRRFGFLYSVGGIGLLVSAITLAFTSGAALERRASHSELELAVARLSGEIGSLRSELHGHDTHDSDALTALTVRVERLERNIDAVRLK